MVPPRIAIEVLGSRVQPLASGVLIPLLVLDGIYRGYIGGQIYQRSFSSPRYRRICHLDNLKQSHAPLGLLAGTGAKTESRFWNLHF